MYTYLATAVRVVDGDTLVLDIDLGFGVWRHQQVIRLIGCNAIEVKEPGGEEARANLASLLPAGTEVTVTSVKVDKFGPRYDAAVTLADGRDLVSVLVAGQWAAHWNGRGPRPFPPWPRRVAR